MREMPPPLGSPRFLLVLASILLRLSPGSSDDASSSKNGTKSETHDKSSGNTGSMVLVVLVVIVVVALFSFVFYKLWQKKKRAEQYARLLKLFEEDDELEVELGLRD
ncbi:hypothetical protein EUGRSUZ_I02780 [Eucalyptus grandis]|uniref:Uncharacterized protein n=6 Tax=Eucalyptus TaxID=3932 RepID=A0A059ATF3_EUCGR|nr:hypothetical protein EUGRSUZ_I02780 [Eucalyptus grandis]KAK3414308.1 hypothetical protein EUGRSUZ_I02780 [Eucalyptus grandis]KAK3414309.1 hypothetical protein EUGRSUZ_I02780 [Eucalyptus grandis]KAK3414310.1 hypothetical protein EUGRSUZ_I02780 [Eucalyptus grandis]